MMKTGGRDSFKFFRVYSCYGEKIMIKILYLSLLLFCLLMGSASSQLWDLGSPEDWLSVGPIVHSGPYYHPFSPPSPVSYIPPTYAYPNASMPSGFQHFFSIDYSQFYHTPVGPVLSHITAPQRYVISGMLPSSLYFIGQTQAVPYSQYQTYATYTGGNSLWIQGTTSWSQYATVPQGSSLTLLTITSTGGSGYLYEIRPDGQLIKSNYYFYPGSSQTSFYADTIGQHILLFSIGGMLSNAIDIDVVGYSPQSSLQPGYLTPTASQPNYNPQATVQLGSISSSTSSPGGY
jgi:hypothetical protein